MERARRARTQGLRARLSVPAPADAAFTALADPTRRRLIETLASGPASASRLAADLPISRQAVAKHLGLLQAAEIVDANRAGRELLYELRRQPLTEVAAWTERVGDAWDRRLSRLAGLEGRMGD